MALLLRGLLAEVSPALREGDARLRQDCSLTAFLSQAKILDNQEGGILGDRPAEAYVVSLAFDITGEGDELEHVGQVFKKVARTASRPLIVSSTPLFHNIRDGHSLPLLGNGVTLYGPKDPKGLLDIHVAIMEDDGGYRYLGKIIEESCEKLQIEEKLAALIDLASLTQPQVFAAKTAIELLFHMVVAELKDNHDDVIQDFHFSALAHQDYLGGCEPVTGPARRSVDRRKLRPNGSRCFGLSGARSGSCPFSGRGLPYATIDTLARFSNWCRMAHFNAGLRFLGCKTLSVTKIL